MRWRPLLLFMPALLLLPHTAARATTMVAQTLEQLSQRSAAVVRATVVSTSTSYDALHRIETVAHVRVTESLQGALDAGMDVDVHAPGGLLDGVILTVTGSPVFADGEDTILFLDGTNGPALMVTDLGQGKFEVRRDAQGHERLTRESLEGVEFTLGPSAQSGLSLTQLRQRVRSSRLVR